MNGSLITGSAASTIAPTKTIARADLMKRIWNQPLNVVAAEVGLSANGLSKLCDRLLIPRPARRYWTQPESQRAALVPDLPPAPASFNELVVLGASPQPRRDRTRLPIEERRTQLLDEAARIVMSEGVAEVSLKRLARDVGISEAQAHNCFARRHDLLVTLTRREIARLEATRRDAVSRGKDVTTQIVLSTINYLHEAEKRGPLLQALLVVPEIRAELREERARNAEHIRRPILASMMARYGISEERALGTNVILTAICVRAGSLLASRRVSRDLAERLCIPIVLAGSRSNAGEGPASSR